MVNISSNCFIASSKTSPFVFLFFASYFFHKNNFTANYVMENNAIGDDMYRKLISIFRVEISSFVNSNKWKLGGTSIEVQIDERSGKNGNMDMVTRVSPHVFLAPLNMKLGTVMLNR
ncbi:hypothetical protein DMUE_4242 [Dictyocoela muelleri]|nr:hypothetical protein DMUE_4242 [Dictyocoela muelleri]